MKPELLQKMNDELKKVVTKIKGKDYVEIKDRVAVFRKHLPSWAIRTTYKFINDTSVVFKAVIIDENEFVIATGTAYEKQDSSHNVNNVSFVENCETSAVGRALGLLGIGIQTAIASADEIRKSETASEAEDYHVYKDKSTLIKAIKSCTRTSQIAYLLKKNPKLFEDIEVQGAAEDQKDLIVDQGGEIK